MGELNVFKMKRTILIINRCLSSVIQVVVAVLHDCVMHVERSCDVYRRQLSDYMEYIL